MAKVGKILVAVASIAAIVALNVYAPGIGSALGGFFATKAGTFAIIAIGSVLISLASSMISNALFKPKTDMSAAKVNTRIEQARRYVNGGRTLQGGQVVFGEFAGNGDLWYVVLHCDSISTGNRQYYLDSVPVTLDGSGNVTTPDFTYKGQSYFTIYTHTYSEANPVPSFASELAAIFGDKWNSTEHLLVGTSYSVVRCRSIKIEDRYKVYRWRGALGLGEPNVALLSDWSNMYDPRDPTQVLGDRTTYKPSRNAAIIWAWWRTHRFGRRKQESEINWQRVAEQANICDQSVTGIEGTQPRYECAIAASDDVDRSSIEQQIMMACDGQLVFDDDGKTWMRVGAYYTPTLTLSRNRDIITMTSVEAQDGESETQGVVVRYIEPSAGYTLQASAPWYNPLWYKPGQGNTFLTVDVPSCNNHNQAMRLAKAFGMRSQPAQKIAPTTGLRGLRAMSERVVNILYDNVFAGDYEIATPVEVDESGMFCSIGATPVGPHNWTLLAGEEKPKPNSESAYQELVLDPATGVTAGYNNGRIEVHFDAPARADVFYEFEYIAQADEVTGQWSRMTTDMDALFAYSGPVNTAVPQLVRWTTVSSGGIRSEPSTPVVVDPLYNGAVSEAIYNSQILEVTRGEPVLTIDADGTLVISDHTRRYPDGWPDTVVTGTTIETGLTAGQNRAVAYDDASRAGGAVTYALYDDDAEARVGPDHLYRHYVGFFSVPTSGTGSGGGGGVPGGGGFCVADDTIILMATPDRTGRGIGKPARDLEVGDWVWTQHEVSMEWGAYRVSALSFIEQPVLRAEGFPRATAEHRFWRDGNWIEMSSLGEPDGVARVAKITVEGAHTYVSANVLSHNVKAIP